MNAATSHHLLSAGGATGSTGNSLQERIKALLGRGLSGSIVASSVGCDPSYISQLMEDEEFKNDVLVLRAAGAQGAIERDDKWDTLEQRALEKMEQILPLVSRPADVIRIAQIANAAKRAARELSNGSENSAPVVNLVLPEGATVMFQMNSSAQVVEVDGRSMAALPTKHLQEQLKQRQLAREEQGIVEVPIPRATLREREKVVSTLEAIGFADEAFPVARILP